MPGSQITNPVLNTLKSVGFDVNILNIHHNFFITIKKHEHYDGFHTKLAII